ncbi:hypothetical protein F0251_13980 [Vibrio sp. 070316B]|uniref:hypothetical protein n=1 Tax=unclassified Vibrio TaxID=2614977 RepID=UPI0014937720|nr:MULTISPECIES: hypothetical protein [unclassified Vibrio]NOI39543.1 hypothetical protein [Vibrio sp. 070316B]NOI84909.1 hypothetical protein [Vibrio sp. 99K-1]
MNRLTWTALVPLLLSMAMVFSTYSYGSESGLEAFTVSLVLSAPLIFTFFLVFSFCRDGAADRHALLGTIAICMHLSTVLLHVWWNGFMFTDVTRNDGLGPAQGYSGLILWLGSIKAMIIGVAVGVCAHFVTRMVRRLAFR